MVVNPHTGPLEVWVLIATVNNIEQDATGFSAFEINGSPVSNWSSSQPVETQNLGDSKSGKLKIREIQNPGNPNSGKLNIWETQNVVNSKF